MRTDNILMLLKTRSELSAADVAKELDMTKEGARLQLNQLVEEGLVKAFHKSKGVGRPRQVYALTDNGHARFPDKHAELTVGIIETIRQTLGEKSLEQVIEEREKNSRERYKNEMAASKGLHDKVLTLAEIRTREGYMAEVEPAENGFYLIEHHCPICAAATRCQSFCRVEWSTFQEVLGEDVNINRTEHIMKGDNRCVYYISKQ